MRKVKVLTEPLIEHFGERSPAWFSAVVPDKTNCTCLLLWFACTRVFQSEVENADDVLPYSWKPVVSYVPIQMASTPESERLRYPLVVGNTGCCEDQSVFADSVDHRMKQRVWWRVVTVVAASLPALQ